MKAKFLLFTFLLSALLIQSVLAAALFENGMIKGEIFDSTANTPIPFANILLYHQKDTTFAGGTASGTTGEFLITNITEGTYLLKVNHLGYANKFVPGIKIVKEHSDFNTGTIKLSKSTLELKGIQVTGEKPESELLLDKKVINVSQNITSSGGTALDVLQNQPSVRVDQDGTVYLRGSSNFTILINGKPSILQGSDALKQISANTIDNIELITNPSSKYDAEGSAGIININLKRQTDYSLSGIFNLNSGTRDKYNTDFSINYNLNGLSLTGGMDYRDNANFNTQEIERTVSADPGSIFNSTVLDIKDKRRQYTGRAGIDYSFDDFNSISLALSAGNVDVLRTLSAKVESVDLSGPVFAKNINEMSMPVDFFNSTLDYTLKLNPDVDKLAFEISYSKVTLPQEQTTNQYTTDNFYLTRIGNPINNVFTNDTRRNEGRTKLDYTHTLTPQSTFEAGYQSNFFFRNLDITNKIFDWNSSTYNIDNSLTNSIYFRNNVHAGYITYSNALLDFNFQVGLRGEYMDRYLQQNTTATNYNYTKMDYFPSFSISRKIDDHQIQFSYSRRVNRPNEYILNPFPFYSDKYLTTRGNPYLLPEYINSYEMNYQKVFGTIFFSAQSYYRNSHNSVNQSFQADNNGNYIVTFENFGTVNTYGEELSSSFSLLQFLKLDPALTLEGSGYKGNINGVNANRKSFNWNARLNASVTFTPTTKLQVSGNYFSKQQDAVNDIQPFFILTASLKQDFLDKKLSLTLVARNILQTSYLRLQNTGNNFSGNIQVKQEVPVISLMLSYNFNNFKRSRPNENVDIQTGM